jgi:hypothetical protein
MIQNDPKDKDLKEEKQDSNVKPDPETLGPEPQEHMKGPISTIVRKISETAEDNDEKNSEDAAKAAEEKGEDKD